VIGVPLGEDGDESTPQGEGAMEQETFHETPALL
jgi:hypothetical protein